VPRASAAGAALIRATHLAPADDAPRLVLADWYDEQGQHERAKLIRWMARVPSYCFSWRQSRWAQRPKHEHAEAQKAIRGLKPRLSALCREESGARRGIERVTMRRGLGESITLPAHVFLATTGELFAAQPFEEVHLSDLHPRSSRERPGAVHAMLCADTPVWEQWPAALFPDREAGAIVTYPDRRTAAADLSARAARHGRRVARILRDPPPLPWGRATAITELGAIRHVQ
jgi:uncharacterized protein (TIGR02996 family)